MARNSITAPNFMRSAMAPTMRAGVMAAKVSWKMTKVSSGMKTPAVKVSTSESSLTGPRKSLREIADEGGLSAAGFGRAGEGQRVAVDHPEDGDHAEAGEDLHQHREHVLGAHEAAVEQREARDGHQDDEDGRDQHPGGVALVDGRRPLSAAASAAGAAASWAKRGQRESSEASAAAPRIFDIFKSVIVVSPKDSGIRARPRRFRRCGCG